jgi:hypothetical protein
MPPKRRAVTHDRDELDGTFAENEVLPPAASSAKRGKPASEQSLLTTLLDVFNFC